MWSVQDLNQLVQSTLSLPWQLPGSAAELVARRKSHLGLWFQVGLILFRAPLAMHIASWDTGPFLDLGAFPLSMYQLAEKEFCPQKFKVRKGLTAAVQVVSQYGICSPKDWSWAMG